MPAKTARLDFRLPEADKKLVEHAAALSGQRISEFALSILRQAAAEVRQQHERTKLTDRDRDLFLAILDNEEPNESLRRAASKYKTDVKQGGPRVVDNPTGQAPR